MSRAHDNWLRQAELDYQRLRCGRGPGPSAFDVGLAPRGSTARDVYVARWASADPALRFRRSDEAAADGRITPDVWR